MVISASYLVFFTEQVQISAIVDAGVLFSKNICHKGLSLISNSRDYLVELVVEKKMNDDDGDNN